MLPHWGGLVVERVEAAGDGVTVFARSGATGRPCRGCAVWSERVHSRYVRRVSDEPVGGQPVTIVLAVRRFYCRNADCVAATFVEQVEGLSQRRRRRSVPLLATLAQVGLALAGRAGARLNPCQSPSRRAPSVVGELLCKLVWGEVEGSPM